MKKSDHHLIQQVLDGTVTVDTFAAFQQRMRAEPELTKLYSEYALLNHTLCEEFEGQKWNGKLTPAVKSTNARFYPLVALAAVVAVAALLLWHFANRHPAPQTIGSVSFSMDAEWQVDGGHQTSGNLMKPESGSTLILKQGLAGIELGISSAVIEGPATITFLSQNALKLSEGRGRFRTSDSSGGLKVTTSAFSALDLGTEFGIQTLPEGSAELHVIDGRVKMFSGIENTESALAAGEAARVSSAGKVERISADEGHFPIFVRRFRTVLTGPFEKSQCRLQYGNPAISEGGMDGENYSAFIALKKPEPGDGANVLLATLEIGKPASGEFHTDGWAGMSFFHNGAEVLFFGDAFGTVKTWSLDVKQRIPVIIPKEPLTGPRTVTLCYHKETGEVSLHEGGIPLGKAFCRGKLAVGTEFDEVRLGASAGAALDVRSLVIRVGGER